MTEEFKDLINGMIHPDPRLRLDMTDILVSPWMRKEIASHDVVVCEMLRREYETIRLA